jgi:hypothetical protein
VNFQRPGWRKPDILTETRVEEQVKEARRVC